jgi:1,4-dihydroxy-2-naphthoyl-CoA synthase
MPFSGGSLRAISAEEVERYGWVNTVVPAERLAAKTLSLAKHIAQVSPLNLFLYITSWTTLNYSYSLAG